MKPVHPYRACHRCRKGGVGVTALSVTEVILLLLLIDLPMSRVHSPELCAEGPSTQAVVRACSVVFRWRLSLIFIV